MPFEYGGQTWPDTTVVTEKFKVTFKEGGSDPEFPLTLYHLCFQSFRNDSNEFSCAHIRNIQPAGGGLLSGEVQLLREGGTRTTAYIQATHSRQFQGSLLTTLDMTQEELAHYNERVVSPNSNQIEMPQAKPYVVPEPGFVLMLAIGLLGLTVVGWLRRTQ